MTSPRIPQSVTADGVIHATDSVGNHIYYHTDGVEARAFFGALNALSAGRNELNLLLHSNNSPEMLVARAADGRTDDELKVDWLSRVTAAGLSEQAASQFLEQRLALGA